MSNSQTGSFLCNRSISLIRTLWKLNKFVIKFCIYKSLSIALQITRYLLLISILKLLSVSKRLEGIIGAKRNDQIEDSPNPPTKSKSPRIRKKRSRSGPVEESTFTTTLTTPIEEVLEETVNEDVLINRKQQSPIKRRSRKSKKSSSSGENSPTDNQIDPGEFQPVRERKSRKLIKKDESTQQLVNNKNNKSFDSSPRYRNQIEIGHREPIKPITGEFKESKKVCSQISYARIVSKSYTNWEDLSIDAADTQQSIDIVEKCFIVESSEQFEQPIEEKITILGPNETNLENLEKLVSNSTTVEEFLAIEKQQINQELSELVQQIIDSEPDDSIEENSYVENNPIIGQNNSGIVTLDEESVHNSTDKRDENQAETVNFAKFEEIGEIVDKFLQIEKSFGIVEEKLPKMPTATQIRVLTLNDKEHQDSIIYRLEKNWILQFRIGPSLMGRTINLYCNYPKRNEQFVRNLYNLYEWQQDVGCNHSDDTANLIEIKVELSGSFHYYFMYDGNDKKHQGSGFFLVDPILKYGNNEELPLDCIQCQTVLAKCLGPFDTWENKLRVAKETGYNMIHFTPIQELGDSNSSYSLREQLKVNPIFKRTTGEPTDFVDIEKLTKKLRTDWKCLSICDIVLNHTANESKWLIEHPECTYNCTNCPYMRPAYLLDIALYQFSLDIAQGLYEDRGIPIEVNTEEHLNAIRYHIDRDIIKKINLHEMFTCDIKCLVAEFANLARNRAVTPSSNNGDESLELLQDPQYRRLKTTIDMELALKLFNVYRSDCFDEDTRLKRCSEDFKHKLDQLNNTIIDRINDHLNAAIDNCIANIRYFRIQTDGPRITKVSHKNPLVPRYFTDYTQKKYETLQEYEQIMYGDKGRFLMAHNGWVMNADPLKNFASPESYVYLRRELIAWGDSVKLRYGNCPDDCPFLWNYMREYVEQTVRIFDGVRLDNCHSTPLPVAEYLLDCARRIRPDLYVVAELFTNSDMTDNIFVNRLGITSLIREAMSAWDSHEQGRLVYRYGGEPVGAFYQPNIRPLVPTIAHALFYDLTHDNPSPIVKRSVFDLLPSTALVNMACCASGSNRGYDELVPHHIHVVDEKRQYPEWMDNQQLSRGNLRYITAKSGIIAAKRALNDLHYLLGRNGFNQVYVDQIDPDIVAITRHCPDTHESYVLVAFTAFGHPSENAHNHQRYIKPLRVEGVLDEIVLEATLTHINQNSKYAKFEKFIQDSQWINGLTEYQVIINQHLQPDNSTVFQRVDSGDSKMIQLNFKDFKPGSIAVIKISLPQEMKDAIKNIRNLIKQFSFNKETELTKIVNQLSLSDLNRCLYRCDQEERDEGYGFDTYNIPNYGKLVYAGLQGFMSLLSTIRPNNDLGHPMCTNLRDGNWMIDYIWQRLKLDEGTKSLGQWFEENTKSLKSIPRYLIPCYFDVIITGLYVVLIEQCYQLMSPFVKNGSTFVKALSLGSVQFGAYIKSADLPTLSPNLAPPKPPQRRNDKGDSKQACITLSAGLPHFSVGYMRNWGRDTFITLRGLLLLTGRYQEARYHILGYAQCLRHGLIPNLLDGGRNSRFNCRDAIWWWLYCIKCYVETVPNGISILSDKISRLFPTDDSPPQPPGDTTNPDQLLTDVIQESLSVHFQGLMFRERNAGKQIDEHMTDKGFNNQIGIHPETGFVFGGNLWNCGTWMDKMGSSDKAGNRGKPATPRDGSAIELIGLSKACISWLNDLYEKKLYPFEGVKRIGKNGNEIKWTFKEWSNRIQANFEKYFYINIESLPDEIRSDLINKRGIYKDCYGATQEWTDYQLRCNFPIAMVVAPELFHPQHAWIALQKAEKYLLGPLGMKTLDPEDWAYNGVYDNANDSDDPKVAHGFNYHQGPEWVWPVGFFLRAKLQFAPANGKLNETLSQIKVILSKHFVELQSTPWRGLPELTNENGTYCSFSSRTQAWSMACILEVLYDLQRIEQKQSTPNN